MTTEHIGRLTKRFHKYRPFTPREGATCCRDCHAPPYMHATFDQWIAELNRVARERFEYVGERELAETSGLDCWLPYYDDGYTPADAIEEDWSNA